MTSIHRLNQKTAAELLGVTARTVREWSAEGFPRNSDGTYSGPTIVAWLVDRRASGDGDYDDQRQRLAAAQSEKVEMENAIRRGEVVDTRAAEAAWAGFVTACRARLLGMPAKLGPLLAPVSDPNEISAHLRREVREALTELADYQPPAGDA